MSYVHLSLAERHYIEIERKAGTSMNQMAEIMELTTGIECIDYSSGKGNKKTEEKDPQLAQAIREIVEPHSKVDPDFKRSFAYVKITAKAVRQALIDEQGYTEEQLPTERTINTLLNRLGYSLKRGEKPSQ